MSGFLLDTNIPSELTRQRPSPQVETWLDSAQDDQLHFSVISLGEILKGITILPASKRRDLIAATALEHDLQIVTRNVKDFDELGVTILNPWETT